MPSPGDQPSAGAADDRIINYAKPRDEFWYLDVPAPPRYKKITLGQVCLLMTLHTVPFVNADVNSVYTAVYVGPTVFPGDVDEFAVVLTRLFRHLPGTSTDDATKAALVEVYRKRRNPEPMIMAVDCLFAQHAFIHNFESNKSATKSLIIQLWGSNQVVPCLCCEKRWSKDTSAYRRTKTNWPYYDCRVMDGFFENRCGNCMYHDVPDRLCTYHVSNPATPSLERIRARATAATIPDNDTFFAVNTRVQETPLAYSGKILDTIADQRRRLGPDADSALETWIKTRQREGGAGPAV